MERGLVAKLERDHASVAEARLADPAACATPALIRRRARETDAAPRCSLKALRRLPQSRLADLLPSCDRAYRAEVPLDAALSTSEPSNRNVELG